MRGKPDGKKPGFGDDTGMVWEGVYTGCEGMGAGEVSWWFGLGV